MRICYRNCLLGLILFLAGAANSTGLKITGTYSDLHYNSEGGDLLGAEVLIIPASGDGGGYVALVQLAEGGAPVSALVPISVEGSKISFSMPAQSAQSRLTFSGTLDSSQIKGTWSSGVHEVLMRKRSYWDAAAI